MKHLLLPFLILLCLTGIANAQTDTTREKTTVVKGIVTDAHNNQPLPFVSVAFNGSTNGIITDAHGKYILRTTKPYTQLKISFIGYKIVIRNILPGQEQIVNFKLQQEGKTLNEVTINSAKRQKYRNKDNPAVELIRKVIAHKAQNRMQSYKYAEYQQYEKLQFSFTNVSATIGDKKIFRKYKFLLDNRDSATLPGKSLLPVYLDEKLSQNYYRSDPKTKKTIVLGEKKVNFGSFIDNEGVNIYLNRMYNEVDLYSNNIFLMTNQFLSPIADEAPTFYKFFITDTIMDGNTKLIELSFTPRNTTDMLFEGEIYITMDSSYAVHKAKLSINRNINLNWVRDMYVNQEFEKNSEGKYSLKKQDMMADFGITKSGKAGLFGERSISYRNYVIDKPRPDSTYNNVDALPADGVDHKSDDFWVKARNTDTLTTAESKVYKNIDSLQHMPSFRRTEDIAQLVFAGYKSFGWFEVGPANTFYSFNPVEGFRLRLGGRTTPELSKRYYFETYAAYGFKDEQWKYFGSATYSINDKSIYRFPQDYFRISIQRDTKIPGADLQFVQEDNFLLSFKRGVNDQYLYNDYYRFDYVHELENHFSYTLNYKYWKQAPAGALEFVNDENGTPNIVPNLVTSELGIHLRYAPHEQLLQGKIYRITIPSKYPILSLDFTAGVKNLFGGEYNYQNLHARVDKRFYLSQLGYTDVTVEGGYIFGQAPFPLLNIHRANQTYSYQLYSYNLMNFLEFVSDHYASLNVDHCFNGFIFNKIPALKHLKLREYITFKALYGGIRDENNPYLHPNLLQFPVNGEGIPTTYALGKAPYTEGSVGIGNIFKFFRVDLVERFNYLDQPNTTRFGIRTRATFDF